jgi:hypothetical protein
VHPFTACHTHELIECPCDRNREGSSDNIGEDRNEQTDEDSGEEDEMSFTRASQLKPGKLNKMEKFVSSTFLMLLIPLTSCKRMVLKVHGEEEGGAGSLEPMDPH